MSDTSLRDSCLKRFLHYVTFDTQSDENSETYPSTAKQLVLLKHLLAELKSIGLKDATMDEHGYVFATIPATSKKSKVPVVGFIAHVDTSPEMPGVDVKPIVHKNYKGQDLVLPDDPKPVLTFKDNPHLADQIGCDIVTASGATLLGADNKSGVAEIVAAAEYLMKHPEIRTETSVSASPPTKRSETAPSTSTSRNSAPRAPTPWTARPAARSRWKPGPPTRSRSASKGTTPIPATRRGR